MITHPVLYSRYSSQCTHDPTNCCCHRLRTLSISIAFESFSSMSGASGLKGLPNILPTSPALQCNQSCCLVVYPDVLTVMQPCPFRSAEDPHCLRLLLSFIGNLAKPENRIQRTRESRHPRRLAMSCHANPFPRKIVPQTPALQTLGRHRKADLLTFCFANLS